jgi:hypothetical protein
MNLRIGPCDHKAAWFIVLVLKIASISLTTASIFLPIWATTGDNELGLFKCSSSCSKNNYKDQRALTCSQADFSEDFEDSLLSNKLHSGCKMFSGLELAFYAYTLCAGASVFFTLVWLFSIFAFCSRKITLNCGVLFGFFSFASQTIGVTFWILKSNTSLSTCSEFPSDGSAPLLCIDVGVKIAMAAGGAYLVLLLVYIIIARKAKERILISENQNFKINVVQPDSSTLAIKI